MEAVGIIWKNNSGITYCSWQTSPVKPSSTAQPSLVPGMSAPVILAYRTLTHDLSSHDDPSSSIFLPKTSFSLNHDPFLMTGLSRSVYLSGAPVTQFSNLCRNFIFEAPNSARKGGDKEKRVRGKTYQMRRLTVKFLDSG